MPIRINLVESIDNMDRIVSITGVMTSSVSGEHKIQRVYPYAGADVQHTDL